MINEPPVDLLLEKLSMDGQPVSRYCLCIVAAKRARQALEMHAASPNAGAADDYFKEISYACREIAEGKIKCAKD